MNNKDGEIVASDGLSESKRPRFGFPIGPYTYRTRCIPGSMSKAPGLSDFCRRSLRRLERQGRRYQGFRISPGSTCRTGKDNDLIHKLLVRAQQRPRGAEESEHGFGVKVVDGSHTDRDAVMTGESDYDILWVRPEEETTGLYGKKYRAGRVSGTQKNGERLELLAREQKGGA